MGVQILGVGGKVKAHRTEISVSPSSSTFFIYSFFASRESTTNYVVHKSVKPTTTIFMT